MCMYVYVKQHNSNICPDEFLSQVSFTQLGGLGRFMLCANLINEFINHVDMIFSNMCANIYFR